MKRMAHLEPLVDELGEKVDRVVGRAHGRVVDAFADVVLFGFPEQR